MKRRLSKLQKTILLTALKSCNAGRSASCNSEDVIAAYYHTRLDAPESSNRRQAVCGATQILFERGLLRPAIEYGPELVLSDEGVRFAQDLEYDEYVRSQRPVSTCGPTCGPKGKGCLIERAEAYGKRRDD